MPNPITRLINGNRYDFSSVEVNLNGVPYVAIQDISYNHSKEVGYLRGTTPHKLGRTRGEYNAEGNFTIYKADYQQFLQLLLPLALGGGYMEAPFIITVMYQELRSEGLITDTLEGCLITNDEDSHSQGSDALMVSVDIDIMTISRGGIRAVADNTGL